MPANREKGNIIFAVLMLVGIVLTLYSCVKEFWPDLDDGSDNLLVVDGKITNAPGPHIVKLSRSSSVDDPEFIPVTKANVIILDDAGTQEYLHETEPGIYQTDTNGIQGVIGRKYKIHIITKGGKAYESDFEELLNPVDVIDVNYQEEYKVLGNLSNEDVKGYQFYITTAMALEDKYFYWEMEETYEYHSAYNIRFYYNGIQVPPDEEHPHGLLPTVNYDTLFYCWKSGPLKERYSYSTEYLSVPQLVNYPLHFIPYTDERLHVKYSLLVRQYTITKRAYDFHKALVEQNTGHDGLVTTQPYQVKSNIKNIKDEEEEVLGYFIVGGVKQAERIFVNGPLEYEERCGLDTIQWHIDRYIEVADPSEWPLYFTYVYFENPLDPGLPELEVLALVKPACVDCTLRGGIAVKPEFWE